MADQRDFLSELSFRTRFKGNRFEEALIQGDPYGLLDAPQPYNYGRAQFRGVDACQPEQNDIGFYRLRSRTWGSGSGRRGGSHS
jgi:hypothetical protein